MNQQGAGRRCVSTSRRVARDLSVARLSIHLQASNLGRKQTRAAQHRGGLRGPGALLPGPWSLQCCPWPARLYPELVLWEPGPCLSHRPVGTGGQRVSKLPDT